MEKIGDYNNILDDDIGHKVAKIVGKFGLKYARTRDLRMR